MSTKQFLSTDDQRVQNNPALPNYAGPDDVSLNYKLLNDENKRLMGDFKVDFQLLINKIRAELDGASHEECQIAIRHLIDASANVTRYITRFKDQPGE